MKKVFAICMALIMVFALSVTVCAAPGSFVNSPSNNDAPIIIEYTNDDENCTANLTVYPYTDRDDLSDEEKDEMENAYTEIRNATDLTNMFSGLTEIIQNEGILADDLAVSDLFHINFNDCEMHNEHGAFRIKLSADTLKGFVAFYQLINGEWQVVSDAAVEDSQYLTFTADELSTFAIVVDSTKAETTSPITGDPSRYVIAALSVMALGVVAVSVVANYKKKA